MREIIDSIVEAINLGTSYISRRSILVYHYYVIP